MIDLITVESQQQDSDRAYIVCGRDRVVKDDTQKEIKEVLKELEEDRYLEERG